MKKMLFFQKRCVNFANKTIREMEQSKIFADVRAAVECMRKGGVILYPTDTVWGIGCDATDAKAVRKVFEIKRRAEAKSMISLVGSVAMLERFVDDIPDVAVDMVELADKPLTIVFDHPRSLAPELLAEDGSAAFRVTSELYSRSLCRELGRPVVSTSANISGNPTPACFSEIDPEIVNAVDYVAEYRRDDIRPHRPSSVVKISTDCSIKIIRP